MHSSFRRSIPHSLLVAVAALVTVPSPARAAPIYQAGGFGYYMANGLYQTELGDIDDDGYLDIVSVGYNPGQQATLLRGQGDGTFVPADTLVVPWGYSLALADMDRDGNLDLLTNGNSMTTVWMGNGDFSFDPGQNYTLGPIQTAWGVAVGDVAGDSLPDVVAPDSSNALVVWEGVGGGALAAIQTLPFVFRANAVRLADLDHDDDLDIIAQGNQFIGPSWEYSVYVFVNNGLGSFVPAGVYVTGATGGLDVGDFDGGGHQDIFSGGSWLRGHGDGQFDQAVVYSAGDGTPRLHDLDQDGTVDLLSSNSSAGSGSPSSSKFRVRLGLGGGALGPAALWPTVMFPSDLDVADLNGDGRLDLVVSANPIGSVLIHLGDGAGGFPPSRSFDAGGAPRRVGIGDLSEDGIPDVLAVTPNQNRLRLLRGIGGGALGSPSDHSIPVGGKGLEIADLDADGHLDAAVLSSGLSVYPGQGPGGFGTRADYPLVGPTQAFTVGDVTGDAIPDVVVVCSTPHTLSVYPGQAGAGLGARMDYPLGTGSGVSYRVRIGELTGDTRPDVVVVISLSGFKALVFPGQPGGTLGTPLVTPLGSITGNTIAEIGLGDTDGDGDLDLHLLTGDQSVAWVRRYLGAGNGTFGPGVLHYGGKDGFALEIVDVTGDSRPDVVVAAGYSNGVAVCETKPDGTFADPQLYGVNAFTVDVAAGDLNGDGLVDLVSADWTDETVTVLLRTTAGVLAAPAPVAAAGAGLAIARVWPTLARGEVHLSFTLPTNGETSVELFDLGGRRLQKGNLGVLKAGANECAIRLGSGIAPGVIWLRLRQGTASAAAKVVVAR